MSDALAIAASGLKAEDYFINSIANDLANLNTQNYKASKISFTDLLYQNLAATRNFKNEQHANIGLGTTIYKTGKDFTSGPLKPTNNWNDVAIDGNGFFQVIAADGNTVYSRNSSLTLDEDRYLASADGLRLADNIQIPEDFSEIKIHKNGEVEAIMADDPQAQPLGSISLAKFLNPEALSPLGAGLYQQTEQSGEAIVDNPGHGGMGLLLQNQIEGSNVDMVSALMQLTMAQRIYQLNAKAVQIADELEKMTIEIRSQV